MLLGVALILVVLNVAAHRCRSAKAPARPGRKRNFLDRALLLFPPRTPWEQRFIPCSTSASLVHSFLWKSPPITCSRLATLKSFSYMSIDCPGYSGLGQCASLGGSRSPAFKTAPFLDALDGVLSTARVGRLDVERNLPVSNDPLDLFHVRRGVRNCHQQNLNGERAKPVFSHGVFYSYSSSFRHPLYG